MAFTASMDSIAESNMHASLDYTQSSYNLTPPDSAIDSAFAQFGDDAEFAAALASYQPCHDCTPATKTTIPHHHHHPSGRLAGASATLDGHFCCSWLIHEDQPCFLCFQSAEALDNHIKNDHAGKDGTYRCLWQNCAKHDKIQQTAGIINFSNKPKLMRHVHSHTGYKPFPCPFPGCDRGFVTKEQLKNHETTHTKARKFKCEHCGKAFAVKSALTTHITAVHKEEKTHKCEICGKAFADSSNLSKHKQTHWRDSGGVKKQRSRRNTVSATSGRSTPSISTPSIEPATPVALGYTLQSPPPAGFMLPPAIPKLAPNCTTLPSVPCCGASVSPVPPCAAAAVTTSIDPADFDPSCYCCDQDCPPPAGPATPCDSPDACALAGFCDLPECIGPEEICDAGCACPETAATAVAVYCCDDQDCGGSSAPLAQDRWEEGMLGPDASSPTAFTQMELDEEFNTMHAS